MTTTLEEKYRPDLSALRELITAAEEQIDALGNKLEESEEKEMRKQIAQNKVAFAQAKKMLSEILADMEQIEGKCA
jgi:transcription elongation GreA/GreB family factor